MESADQQDNKIKSLHVNILEERIERYSESFEEGLKAYRNYTIVIILLLFLFGVGAIYSLTKVTVRDTMEGEVDKYLEKILLDGYMEGKIKSYSSHAISEIAAAAEEKSREIFGSALNFSQWMEYGSRAFHEGKYKYSIVSFERAIRSIPTGYRGIDGKNISNSYLSIVEACILTSDYEKAKIYIDEYENKFSPELLANYNYAVFYFYKIILTKLDKEKTDELDQRLDQLLQKEPIVFWDFSATQEWMKMKLKQEAFLYVDSKLKSIMEKASEDSWINLIE